MHKWVQRAGVMAPALTMPAAVFAASATAPTDRTAGFYDMGQFFNQVLTGDGGFAIVVIGIILGGVMLAITGRWTYLAGSAGVALLLGFGVPVITAVAGVSADIGMVSMDAGVAMPAEVTVHAVGGHPAL